MPKEYLVLVDRVIKTRREAEDTVGSCTAANCSSIEINGQVFRSSVNNNMRAKPFVMQAFAGSNECLRFETVYQAQEPELTVVTPDGTV